ncbi:hypothetical protein NCWK1_2253 [Nostoc cycadae WK-1]|uniref:Uncharacterized protein n=1 Tax=Nostoc cycadae WK-1 TaxID=1861711 RepID=A0A2H6LH03_9NOSO|nr:hypothetical protein NCWK1_2253 [Nostoc cycadae WK-1]
MALVKPKNLYEDCQGLLTSQAEILDLSFRLIFVKPISRILSFWDKYQLEISVINF